MEGQQPLPCAVIIKLQPVAIGRLGECRFRQADFSNEQHRHQEKSDKPQQGQGDDQTAAQQGKQS